MSANWHLSRSKRVQAAAIAAVGYPLINALGHTLKWRVEGLDHVQQIIASGRQPVMAFWHGRILPATFYFRHRGIWVMSSVNFDAEWTAGIIHRFGFKTARGSTSRGARRALLQLVRESRGGQPVGFTLDGPRGPARVAQPGAVWLARATGNPVLPFHLEASSHWTLNSWDHTQIPKPFSTVAIAVDEPMEIPPDTPDERLEEFRTALESRLSALEARTLTMLRS